MSVEHDLRPFPPVPSERVPIAPADEEESSRASQNSDAPVHFDWRKNVLLFVLTVVSVFFTLRTTGWERPWQGAVPLLVILLCHEFGHYFAARVHRVRASLPYFLPLPLLGPFGTLGAVILMPNRIRSRRALLDIGAAGPLAGMVAAIPLMLYGLSLSTLGPRGVGTQEGQSLLYMALKYLVFGPIPADQDVYLHPTAFAAWGGFLVTFLNLLPIGQLDGGHIAYALFGERFNKWAPVVRFVPLALIVYNFAVYVVPVLLRVTEQGSSALDQDAWQRIVSALGAWVVFFVLLGVMKRVSGFDHPPVDDHELSFGRKCIAVFSLVLFVLLFVPSPLIV
jgi:membrane-associated protease RseP (regulator of RpoE activity)